MRYLLALCAALLVTAVLHPAHAQQGKRMTTSSGLQIIEVKEGTGPAAKGKTATVHYTGWLYTNGQKGTKFDSSVGGEPFSFPVGADNVVKGRGYLFGSMEVGRKRKLYIQTGR
jgi:peptidylprolyl isomerase